MGKGFIIGYTGKIFINILYPILNILKGRRVGLSIKAILFKAQHWGLFAGSLLATYNSFMYESKKYVKLIELIKNFRALIAGALAGLSLIWVPKENRWSIVLLTFVRAFELQVKLLHKSGSLPTVPHSDVLLMGLASSTMLHTWVYRPHTLDPSYNGFLTKQSQTHPVIRKALGDMQIGKALDIEAINKVRAEIMKAKPLTESLGYDKWNAGEILFPNKSMIGHFGSFFIKGMKLALPVYIPVFAVPILMFYPNQLLKKPFDTTKRLIQGIIRSSVFLTTYCASGVASLPILRSLGLTYSNFGAFSQIIFFISGLIAGCSTLIEKKGRRIELALYVLSKGLEARWNQISAELNKRNIAIPKNGDVLVFAYSFAIIAHVYHNHSEMLRDSYMALLAKFLDSENRHVFYSVPKVLSEKIISLGSQQKLGSKLLTTIQQAQRNSYEDDEI